LSWDPSQIVVDRSAPITDPVPLYVILEGVTDVRALGVDIRRTPNSASGRRRATVVDGPADPGLHTVEFDPARCDGGGLEAGVYFVTLEHCGAAQADKLVVLR
jgi:hypothetical protein